jgi:tRNA 2-thiouridine synthesizing protein E
MTAVRTPVDTEGYLIDLDAWNESVAMELATQAGITLTPDHLAVVAILRDFYEATGVSPSMRPLVKLVRERLGPERGTSIHLLGLFPGNPAKLAAKIAGLPRPTNCV